MAVLINSSYLGVKCPGTHGLGYGMGWPHPHGQACLDSPCWGNGRKQRCYSSWSLADNKEIEPKQILKQIRKLRKQLGLCNNPAAGIRWGRQSSGINLFSLSHSLKSGAVTNPGEILQWRAFVNYCVNRRGPLHFEIYSTFVQNEVFHYVSDFSITLKKEDSTLVSFWPQHFQR